MEKFSSKNETQAMLINDLYKTDHNSILWLMTVSAKSLKKCDLSHH